MILEVLDGRTGAVRTRVRLDALPLTVGRGYDNDLILDDPYVDARHARVARDEAGGVVVEDLGSVNGLVVPGVAERVPRFHARAGATLRIGRTALRFRDPAEPVPPALVDGPGDGARLVARVAQTAWARAAICAAAVAATAIDTWLGSYERSTASEVFAVVVGLSMLAFLWAGVWAVAGRMVVHRFHFLGHLAVSSAVFLAFLGQITLAGWAMFLFPDNPLQELLGTAVLLALVAALVAGHLALASTLSRKRRWRAGLIVSGLILVLGALAVFAEGDAYTDIPTFPGVVKPVAGRWLPAASVEEFGGVVTELKDEVDAMADRVADHEAP